MLSSDLIPTFGTPFPKGKEGRGIDPLPEVYNEIRVRRELCRAIIILMKPKGRAMAMPKDEIVEEVRRHRDAYVARFNYDLDAIYRDLKAKERKSKRKLVSRSLQNIRSSLLRQR
jgi:hypothetical protein